MDTVSDSLKGFAQRITLETSIEITLLQQQRLLRESQTTIYQFPFKGRNFFIIILKMPMRWKKHTNQVELPYNHSHYVFQGM